MRIALHPPPLHPPPVGHHRRENVRASVSDGLAGNYLLNRYK
jgi:hypothetical protein